ncbi:MAG: hypothetical protein AB7T37_03765 [Dehalococcoidia bacterium]
MQGRPPKHRALRSGHRRHPEMALAEAGRDRQSSVVPRMPAAERGLIEPKVRGLWKTLWKRPAPLPCSVPEVKLPSGGDPEMVEVLRQTSATSQDATNLAAAV